jgi:small subunit ribosomal protein S13
MVFLEKNSDKKVYQALNNIKGLSNSNSEFICKKFGFQKTCTLNNLDSFNFEQLKNYLNKNYFLDNLLIEQTNKNVKKKIDLGTYTGKRHNLGYPVRGQRTLSNGKTQRNLHKFRFYYDLNLFSHIFFKNQRKSVKNQKIAKLKAKKKKEDIKNQRQKVLKKINVYNNNNFVQKQILSKAKKEAKKEAEKKAYMIKLNKIKAERKKQIDARFTKEHKQAQINHPYFLNISKGKTKKKKS